MAAAGLCILSDILFISLGMIGAVLASLSYFFDIIGKRVVPLVGKTSYSALGRGVGCCHDVSYCLLAIIGDM